MPTVGTLTLHEYNDETVFATLYADVDKTVPLNLAGASVEFIYKTSSAQADVDALTIPAIIINAAAGTVRVEIGNEVVSLTKKFFRIDVISGSERKTAVYGTITVIDL